MSQAHLQYEARADLPVTSHYSGVQGTLPQAANIQEILTTESFMARMGICEETLRNWKKTEKLRNGVHYLQIGSKMTFPWPHAYIMLMKDIQEQNDTETTETPTQKMENKVARRVNIGQTGSCKNARAREPQSKINLSYSPQKSN